MGLGAYSLWGLFPAFFPLLDASGATEILAHRMVWTVVLMLGVLTVTSRLGYLRRLSRRQWGQVAAASVLISVNWGTYIYAVNTGRVAEAALGYYINPLVSVLLAVLVLGEPLRRAQLAALALAGAAVVVLTLDYGRLPYLALTLAGSFGLYGLIKKTITVDPRTSLTGEGLVLAPVALAWIITLELGGSGTFTSLGVGHTLLLLATGPITAVPLLLFAGASQRLPLVTIALLQYLTPTLQLIWAVAVKHEEMTPARWAGFALVWVALVIFSTDLLRSARSRRTAGAQAVRATL